MKYKCALFLYVLRIHHFEWDLYFLAYFNLFQSKNNKNKNYIKKGTHFSSVAMSEYELSEEMAETRSGDDSGSAYNWLF